MAIPFRQLMRLAREAGISVSPEVLAAAPRTRIPFNRVFVPFRTSADRPTRGGMFGLPEPRPSSGTLPEWLAGNVFDAPPSAVRASRLYPTTEPSIVPRRPRSEEATAREAIEALLGTRAGRTRRPTYKGYQYRDVIDAPGLETLGPRGQRPEVTRTGAERAARLRTQGEATLEDLMFADDPFTNAVTRVGLAGRMGDAAALARAEQYARKVAPLLDDAQLDALAKQIRGYRQRIGLEVGEETTETAAEAAVRRGDELRVEGEGTPLMKIGQGEFNSLMLSVPKLRTLKDVAESYDWAFGTTLMENKLWRDQYLIALEQRANAITKEELRRRFMGSTRTLADALGIEDSSKLTSAQFDEAVNNAVDAYLNARLIRKKGVNWLPQGGKSSRFNESDFRNAIVTSHTAADLLAVQKRLAKLNGQGIIPADKLPGLQAAYMRQSKLVTGGAFKRMNEYMDRDAAIDIVDFNDKVRKYITLKDVKPKRDYEPIRARGKGVRPADSEGAAYTADQPRAPTSTWRGKEGDMTVEQFIASQRGAKWEDAIRKRTSTVEAGGRVQGSDPFLALEETAPAGQVVRALENSTNSNDMKLVAQLRDLPPDEIVPVPPRAAAKLSPDDVIKRPRKIDHRDVGLSKPYVVGETGEEVLGPPSAYLREVAGQERVKRAAVDWKDTNWFNKSRPIDPALGLTRQEWIDNYGYRNLARIRGAENVRELDRALALVEAAKAQGLVDEGFWKLVAMEYSINMKRLRAASLSAMKSGRRRDVRDSRFIKTKKGTFVRRPNLRQQFNNMDELANWVGPTWSIRRAG